MPIGGLSELPEIPDVVKLEPEPPDFRQPVSANVASKHIVSNVNFFIFSP